MLDHVEEYFVSCVFIQVWLEIKHIADTRIRTYICTHVHTHIRVLRTYVLYICR